MDDLEDHRPYFTYWVTTVQMLVMLISLACYGFGPIGFELQQQSGTVSGDQRADARELLGCYKEDIRHLHGRYQVVIREVLDSHKGGFWQLQGGYQAVTRGISDGYEEVSDGYKGVTRQLQGSYQAVTREIPGSCKGDTKQ